MRTATTTGGGTSPAALARALLDTASIIRAVPGPMRVAPTEPVATGHLPPAQDLLDRLTTALGLPGLDLVEAPDRLTAVELAVSRRLALRPPGAVAEDEVRQAARAALAAFPGPAVVVPARDGTPLRCWVAGPRDAPAVALVSACGMPVGLAAKWLSALSAEHRVVTWESRNLFAADDGTGLGEAGGHTLDAQSADVLDVLDGFGIAHAHALGLCGGAVIALAAAARSDRITSLSLWHGDYELGGDAPKTAHQQDIEALLAMVSRGRTQAAAMHRMMSRPSTLDTLRPDIAHHLIHPYATPDLLHRYGLLNGALMTADCRGLLDAPQPTLVVTSHRDTTAHPAGSAYVARRLPRAELRTLPHGDHLTAFDAAGELVALARDFLHTVTVPDRRGT
ncbi:alpha/beta hydrolase [Streptomyces sp. NPDC050732]|uniref:alpha/beta fold hydrolase n=1 Tax=Streptomyces sp. NPDC050732 TaxID=3154632 RepID=UPI0034171F79